MQTFLDSIYTERPDLKTVAVTYPKRSGRRCHTVFLGNEVFKTPIKGEQELSAFELEYKTLCHIYKSSCVVSPRITHIGQKYPFYGMEKLPGVPLWKTLESFDQKQMDQLCDDIAEFIYGMQSAFSQDDIKKLGIPEYEWIIPFEKVIEALENGQIRLTLEKYGLYKKCIFAFSQYERALFASTKTLIVGHGDLLPGNMLADPLTKRLTGIIDPGRVGIRRIENELLPLCSKLPDLMIQNIVARYCRKTNIHINLQTLRMISAAEHLHSLSKHLPRHANDPAKTKRLMNCLGRNIKAWDENRPNTKAQALKF